MAKVYIVHGYGATAESNWFPWLEAELTQRGIACERLNMPDTQAPNAGKWLDYLIANVEIDDQTVVVGHSLGCIALMNFLAKTYARPAGAVFVSGFYQPVEGLAELEGFSNLYAILPPLTDFPRYVLAANDDNIVPQHYSDKLAQHLNATYLRLPHGGHFIDQEGYTALPEVLELIEKLLATQG